MKKRSMMIFLVILFCLTMGGIFANTPILTNTPLVSQEKRPIDIGPTLREKEVLNYPIPNRINSEIISAQVSYYQEGDLLEWYCLDDYDPAVTDGIFIADFQLRAIGDICEIWVQVDMSFPDSRDTPIITDEQVQIFLSVFETTIYPKVTEYFGVPDFHDGSQAVLGDTYYEPNGRNVILISNIRDTSFYDPQYPYYIVGFYWGVFEDAFDRNIISIDSEGWETAMAVYEATLAHEYQHLIHDDYNPDDPSFMNEGCSMYAEPLCGYEMDVGYIEAFLATPDNSLTEWGDQGDINILADYGQCYLWATYLADHYGGAGFLSYFVKNGTPGIEGINNALAFYGFSETFDDVFHDWRIANLIHTDQIGGGRYNYNSLDLSVLDDSAIRVYDVQKPFFEDMTGVDFGETTSYIQDKTGIYKIGSYGSDYVLLNNIRSRFNPLFYFDGDNFAELPTWIHADEDGDGDLEWYSSPCSPEKDVAIYATIDLTTFGETPILSFDTKYTIEEAWDFGFVQISLDEGQTWTSLENEYTRYDAVADAYPTIKENLPGLTGDSGGWISMSFNLSSYATKTVQLAFRYMTDWGTEEIGWYVDNIAINSQIVDDGEGSGLFFAPPPPETDFIVTLIVASIINEEIIYNWDVTLDLNDVEESLESPIVLNQILTAGDSLYLIISPKLGIADYKFSILKG